MAEQSPIVQVNLNRRAMVRWLWAGSCTRSVLSVRLGLPLLLTDGVYHGLAGTRDAHEETTSLLASSLEFGPVGVGSLLDVRPCTPRRGLDWCAKISVFMRCIRG